jgi:hypothetical protein
MLEKGSHGRRIHAVSECSRAEQYRRNHSEQSRHPAILNGKKGKEYRVPSVGCDELSPVQGKTQKGGNPYGCQHFQFGTVERHVPLWVEL